MKPILVVVSKRLGAVLARALKRTLSLVWLIVMTQVVPNTSKTFLIPIIKENVTEGATISKDDWNSYHHLDKSGYMHGIVKHRLNELRKGINHTNTIEGFW